MYEAALFVIVVGFAAALPLILHVWTMRKIRRLRGSKPTRRTE